MHRWAQNPDPVRQTLAVARHPFDPTAAMPPILARITRKMTVGAAVEPALLRLEVAPTRRAGVPGEIGPTHPKAVAVFERDWLVTAILFGNYGGCCATRLSPTSAPRCGAARCRWPAPTAT